jgi:hypothetical protein
MSRAATTRRAPWTGNGNGDFHHRDTETQRNGNSNDENGKNNVNSFSPRRHGDTENGENQENNPCL